MENWKQNEFLEWYRPYLQEDWNIYAGANDATVNNFSNLEANNV